MSKYQRLNEYAVDVAATEDDEASVALFFTHNQHHHQQQQQEHAELQEQQIHERHNIMLYNSNSYNHNNNNSNHNNSSSNFSIDADEHTTMEVPLLNNNSNNSNNNNSNNNSNKTSSPSSHAADDDDCHCHCGLPGFGANLVNKSTHEAKVKILCAISLCCIFMIIEFLGGYVAGSLAIMTDAAHLASDCITFVIGLASIWLGSRPPDAQMSFGYKRMEVMGAIISILCIWILTATLVLIAIERLFSNDYDLDANTMMTISGIGILINIAMVFILHGSVLLPAGMHGHSHGHGHSHDHEHNNHDNHTHPHHVGESVENTNDVASLTFHETSMANGNATKQHSTNEKNLNLRAALIHVIGDLVQSIGVFLASVLIKCYPNAKFADPLCTLIFSIIVVCTTARLFKESIGILLDSVPQNFSLVNLKRELSHIEGVRSIHHLNVWNHTSNHSILMAHLVVDLLADTNTVLKEATNLACGYKYNIKHCTIQIERVTV